MRYNRGSLDSAMAAAQRTAKKHERDTFVWATAYGFTITFDAPPFGQQHYRVSPDGRCVFSPKVWSSQEA